MSNPSVDILHIMRPAAGGMREHVFHLARSGEPRGYRVAIACPPGVFSADDRLYNELRASGVDLIPIALPGDINPIGDLAACARLAGIISRMRPRLLHLHGFKAAFIGRAGAAVGWPFGARPVIIYTVHNSMKGQSAGKPLIRSVTTHIERAMLPLTHGIIVVSRALGEEYSQFAGGGRLRIEFIPNGIDLDRFDSPGKADAPDRPGDSGGPDDFGRCRGGLVIGTAARLIAQKGIDTLLRAFALVSGDFPSARLVVAGDGPERQHLEDLALSLGLGGRAKFLGYEEDIPGFLSGLDVFVLASVSEGMPLSIIEAMASGIPVVATGIGGIPEIVDDGATGLLVRPSDHEAIAKAIRWVLSHPDESRVITATARKVVRERFSAQAMADRTYEFYESFLSNRVPGRSR